MPAGTTSKFMGISKKTVERRLFMIRSSAAGVVVSILRQENQDGYIVLTAGQEWMLKRFIVKKGVNDDEQRKAR